MDMDIDRRDVDLGKHVGSVDRKETDGGIGINVDGRVLAWG